MPDEVHARTALVRGLILTLVVVVSLLPGAKVRTKPSAKTLVAFGRIHTETP